MCVGMREHEDDVSKRKREGRVRTAEENVERIYNVNNMHEKERRRGYE
jgi:hypothetical protein